MSDRVEAERNILAQTFQLAFATFGVQFEKHFEKHLGVTVVFISMGVDL